MGFSILENSRGMGKEPDSLRCYFEEEVAPFKPDKRFSWLPSNNNEVALKLGLA